MPKPTSDAAEIRAEAQQIAWHALESFAVSDSMKSVHKSLFALQHLLKTDKSLERQKLLKKDIAYHLVELQELVDRADEFYQLVFSAQNRVGTVSKING